jgi:2-keto-4-pentenoate hydratase/2-oxohepta-3-ene-1,7-dioic acid hydratase in catechol pathway
MKLVSYENASGTSWGILKGDHVLDGVALTKGTFPTLKAVLKADALNEIARQAAERAGHLKLTELNLLPVIPDPGKIICVGLNYEEHRIESKREPTSEPTLFLRTATSQAGHGQALICPPESIEFDYEGEIAIVIGKGGRRIAQDDAWNHIAGYAPYNDGSIRDWQRHTSQFTAGKNFDKTGGFGPYLTTRDEIADGQELTLITRLNGEVMQQATTEQMIFGIPRLLHYISTFTTLEPGDVIVTGTPGGVGVKRDPPVFMRRGDRVEVEITGVATLSNPIE